MVGIKVLEEIESPINGKIQVVKSLGFGTYIQVEGLTQSGGVVYDVWRSTLRKIRSTKHEIRNCLILGLGGGSAAKLVRKFWSNAEIVGVDKDPVMIKMGKKYLGLGKVNIKITVADAFNFLKIPVRPHEPIPDRYGLVLVDLYIRDQVPRKFETYKFIRSVRHSLTESGLAVFNRLYWAEKRPEAMKFGQKLEKIFPKVEYFYPEANVMFVCYT